MPRVAVLAELDLRGIDDATEALVGVADSLEGLRCATPHTHDSGLKEAERRVELDGATIGEIWAWAYGQFVRIAMRPAIHRYDLHVAGIPSS